MSNAGSGNGADDNSKENSDDEDEEESNDGLISAGVREGGWEGVSSWWKEGGRQWNNWLLLN